MFTVKSSKNDFPKRTGKKYKVLINAGGGLFGYIITNFMSYLDFDLYSKVDVVAGTSIGGILSLAYCVNNDYKYINSLFETGGPKIFDHVNKLYCINAPKYDNKNLRKFLEQIYGDAKLSDISKMSENDLKAIITTTDYTLIQPRIFQNINLKEEQDISLVDLGMYTSAAPTYFNAHNHPWKMLDYDPEKIPMNEKLLLLTAMERQYLAKNPKFNRQSVIIDGGLLENIPVISTYTTLHNELGVNPQDLDVFIIGTGHFYQESDLTAQKVNKWSIIQTALNLIVPYVTSSNEQTSIFWGSQMGFNSFTYYNPIKAYGQMDDAKQLPGLKKECEQHRDQFIQQIMDFLNK